jgi:hypothetical protein
MMGYQTFGALHDLADPLIMKPPYELYASAVTLTLLTDAGAVQLFRMASLAVAK